MSYPSTAAPAYGDTLYFPAGTTARFRFTARQTPTGLPYDLTGATLTLYLKTSETVADASASLTATVANGKLVVMDALLGVFDWLLFPADTSPTAYTPGSPWFRTLKLTTAGGDVYTLAGSAGPVVMDATAPAVGTAGQLVAYAPSVRAEAVGPSSSPVPAYATITYVDDALDALFTRASATNDGTGNTTLTLPTGSRHHTVDLVLTGSAGTRTLIAATTGAAAGDVLRLDYTLPATAGLVVELRNATAGGTLLDSLTTDTSADPALISLTYSGTVWQLNSALYPAA